MQSIADFAAMNQPVCNALTRFPKKEPHPLSSSHIVARPPVLNNTEKFDMLWYVLGSCLGTQRKGLYL